LTATSANVSDEPATDDPDEVARTLGDRIDILVDGGRTPGGPPSTIVDATGSTLRLVRPGAVSWDEVLACLQRA
jgi:tRNA A37 threonylcarbamoyladenosine synthetase subunit TsaC/SUA5/YrdC